MDAREDKTRTEALARLRALESAVRVRRMPRPLGESGMLVQQGEANARLCALEGMFLVLTKDERTEEC